MKKKQTAEEKLRAALVPEAEQPYALPKKWCWVRLGSLNEFISKSVNPKIEKDKTFELYSVPSYDAQYPEIIESKAIGSSKVEVSKEDVLLCKINPRINRVWKVYQYTDYPLLASGEWIVIRNKLIDAEYLVWALRSNYFRQLMQENVSGVGGSLMRAKPKFVSTYPVPLAPMDEQKRIVTKLQSFMAKLDEAKEKVEQVLDTFETRKAAILHAAFTGKLTEQWRKERGVGEETWRHTFLKDICLDIKVGIVIKPSQYYTDSQHGVPAFRSANVREFYVNDSDWVYIDERGQKDNQRTLVHEGDVLIVRSGNPGTACVVPHNCDGYGAIDILIAVPNNKLVIPEYLCAFTNSPLGKKLVAENKRGMALAHFNVKGYSNLPIFLPTLEEQRKIVNIATTLLAKEQQAKDLAEAQLAQIDTLKKSILARAFRGELGTSRQSDRSALDELKAYFAGEGES